jgi:hypothetical protein
MREERPFPRRVRTQALKLERPSSRGLRTLDHMTGIHPLSHIVLYGRGAERGLCAPHEPVELP